MIYLDNNATTAPLPEVVDAVTDILRGNWGNPSSAHALGRKAREALESARHAVASAFGIASPSALVFTASGTESINLGFACLLSPEVRQILVSATEHSAVLRAAERRAEGRTVVRIPVHSSGALDLDSLRREAGKYLSLVSVALANNETGVIADISSIATICRETDALLHVDAVQAAGKIPLQLDSFGCDAVSLAAHKFHGPPGCGILYLRQHPGGVSSRVPAPGHHEQGLRAGTENLPAIVGCGVAASLLQRSLDDMPRVESLRDQLESALLDKINGSEAHGRTSPRLPNTTNLYFPGRNASDLVAALSRLGLAASAGAACSNGGTASHVIKAMGFSDERANSALRLSLSCHTTSEEIAAARSLAEQAFNLTPAINR
jgi:cysteine desulfurase